MEINVGKYAATRQSWSRTNIRVIYSEIKKSKPRAAHTELVKLLAERMREDDDALMAAADYVITNCEEAEEGYANRAKYKKRAQDAEHTADDIKNHIILLNLEMPNGKRMRYCTGTELASFGKGYQRIARKVGSKMVGSVLDEKQVRALMR
jgi:hypothetical protein